MGLKDDLNLYWLLDQPELPFAAIDSIVNHEEAQSSINEPEFDQYSNCNHLTAIFYRGGKSESTCRNCNKMVNLKQYKYAGLIDEYSALYILKKEYLYEGTD